MSTGVAYRGLKGKTLFPVVSSTAARSGMKVISCRSVRTSLQFMCCQVGLCMLSSSWLDDLVHHSMAYMVFLT